MSGEDKQGIEKLIQSDMDLSSSNSKPDCAAPDLKLAFCVSDLMKKVDRMLTKLDTIDKLEEKMTKDDGKSSEASAEATNTAEGKRL